jgi:hypothetical protein
MLRIFANMQCLWCHAGDPLEIMRRQATKLEHEGKSGE